MRIIEGNVNEIVEYQRRMGTLADTEEKSEVPEPDGNEPPAAVSAEDGLAGDDGFYIQQHVFTRATSPAMARRVLRFIDELPEGTAVEIGSSERTSDGWSNYLMVRDDGSQKYGAVVYVLPHSGRLTFRLRPQDVTDFDNADIVERSVVATQKYAIRYMLTDDSKLEAARSLTERALKIVRE